MKTFQGAFHLNDDISTWYVKMKKDLLEIREAAERCETKRPDGNDQ
jgi:hypothetical protein